MRGFALFRAAVAVLALAGVLLLLHLGDRFMRKLPALVAVALIACTPFSLAACASRPPAVALSPAQVASRAMLAAETAFNVAATAELDAKGVGLLTGEKAEEADRIRKDAYQVLLALRAAHAAGETPNLTSLLVLTNQLLALSGKPVPTVPMPNVPTL